MRNAVLGTGVAVRYLDDDVDHESILVWPVSPVHLFVISPDDDCRVEDLSARSARDGLCAVECPVRHERGPGDQLLYRFQDDMGREKLLRLMTECRERADKEPSHTGTEACRCELSESGLVASGSFLSFLVTSRIGNRIELAARTCNINGTVW